MQPTIYSISQLNTAVKLQLESEFAQIWLTGEISNFTQPVSGHWYFSLKDSAAQVRAAMFRGQNYRTNFRPQNGTQVLVCAKVSLYEARGDYQLIVEKMLPAGDGLLQLQFETLKQKLTEKGYFANQLKKTLPPFCQRVGIVTSTTGAALQDILKVLRRRDPTLEIVIYPSLVQGKEAAQNIAEMIELANLRQEVDVLIIGRGGGSLEDLWCFNEEIVAEAIYRSNLPIISAVGHEVDVTIADFVADVRAATPSVAAELVSQNRETLKRRLQVMNQQLDITWDYYLGQKNYQLHRAKMCLLQCHPQRQLTERLHDFQRLDFQLQTAIQLRLQAVAAEFQQLIQSIAHYPIQWQLQDKQQKMLTIKRQLANQLQILLHQQQAKYATLCTKLDQLSPLTILARGYGITFNLQGEVVKNIDAVQKGERICTRLMKGTIVSCVEKTHSL